MKCIKIMRISLENFKCHRNLTLEFMGKNMSIYGDNAAGKTSIYDALTWLLFGKDSAGNGEKNVEVKPLNSNGEVADHLAVTAVSVDLEVDGRLRNLRRTFRERWVTKRGHSEPEFDGNTSEYYVDGVPKQKTGFMEEVSQIVDEDAFRMLTSVSHFADGICWQDRRNILFDMAGTCNDKKILATDERFTPVLDSLGDLSLSDYKKKLQAQRRDLTGARSDIPARISECEKTVDDISAIDFSAKEAELLQLRNEHDRLNGEILAIDNSTAVQAKKNELDAARVDLQKLDTQNQAFRAAQPDASAQLNGLRAVYAGLQRSLTDKRGNIAFTQRDTVVSLDSSIERCRQDWIKENSLEYSGDTVCPTCGQPLPADRIRFAVEKFEAEKAKHLKDIETRAGEYKASREKTLLRISQFEKEAEDIQKEMDDVTAQMEQSAQAAAPIQDMEGYCESRDAICQKIDILNSELADLTMDANKRKTDLQEQLRDIQRKINGCQDICSRKNLLQYTQNRISELREDATNTAAALDAVDKMLFLLDDYTRYKTQFVEDSVNNLFTKARFRLFREQANGGTEDRCDVVYNGVPYSGLNNGMKINIGIDIIKTLSRHYGVSVPLFIDNAESVTKLEAAGSQVIRLVVSENDKELRVNAD